MELTTYERLVLLTVLPGEDDITTMKIVRELKGELSFSEDELKALELSIDAEGKAHWKSEADKPKEIKIGDVAKGIIKKVFVTLNEKKKIQEAYIPMYEKFVEGAG